MGLFTATGYFLIVLVTVRANSLESGSRIIGGVNYGIEKIPYQLSLEKSGKHICGATILGEKRAITAAHCTFGIPASELKVRVGSNQIQNGGQLIQVSNCSQHPNFDNITLENDISILLLENSIKMNKTIKAIDPNWKDAIKVNTTVLTSGWDGNILHALNLSIIDRDTCQKYFTMVRLTNNKICATSNDTKNGPCEDDSGSALVLNNKLIGITSWTKCNSTNFPTIFTNVQNYEDFIKIYSNGVFKMSLSNIAYFICILHIIFNSFN
ncbi:PREDICTED: trypsin-4-like [Nicrophorus vespilloides]|uniref:Trypsin-4-like n=1 Tax=Nicrophorus vespilloides TaxID=110193 RepID=A0ABM1M4I1_NICVS|nr:PREDICTED: trypsin-4-like [Nicrophorus vespilloides]